MNPVGAASNAEVSTDYTSHAGDDPEAKKLAEEATEGSPEIEVGKLGGTIRKKTSRDAPAPVTPIGALSRIPSIEPVNTDKHTTPKALPVYEVPKDHLVGMIIDEWGDVVDENGTVLGRVEGDLPSMIGRKISNSRGDIFGDDGELLGYVSAVGPEDNQQKIQVPQKPSQEEAPTRSLDEVMRDMAAAGKGPGGLRVDQFGNILDAQGNSVGSFHDKATGFGKKSGAFPDTDLSDNGSEDNFRTKSSSRPKVSEARQTPVSDRPEGTATERRDKAQARKKEENPLNPSDIFLDVKSTHEGIQLTIRIPTVFSSKGEPMKPRIVFE